MNQHKHNLNRAFPSTIDKDVNYVLANLDLNSRHLPSGSFSVRVGRDQLEIPYRIYYSEKNLTEKPHFSQLQKDILNCLFSRHHSGFIREECIKKIVVSDYIWVPPYVLRLLGEYVIEILHLIHNHLDSLNFENYIEFIRYNSEFYELTRQRMISYWNCYYRNQFFNKKGYVGFQIFEFFDKLIV